MKTIAELIKYFSDKKLSTKAGKVSPETKIVGGRNITEAGENEITFLSAKYKDSARSLLEKTKAPLVIIDSSLYAELNPVADNKFFVLSSEPKAAMIDCLTEYFLEKESPMVHSSAIIHPEVVIGKAASIGPNVVIEKDVIIGDNCTIEPFVFIRSGTRIGNNVVIKSGAVIGGKGFGFVQQADKTWKNFPHFGRVILEDNVEIGSNTCIDRGALSDTVLKKGVKVDNLVHIAHNVTIGENSLIIANSMIGGSTSVGENSWVSPSASLKNGLTIGPDTLIGMGAVVLKNVEAGTTIIGNPGTVLIKKSK